MDQGTYVDYSRRPQTSDTTWRSRPSARPINDQTPMSLKRSNLKHQAERRRWRYSSKRLHQPCGSYTRPKTLTRYLRCYRVGLILLTWNHPKRSKVPTMLPSPLRGVIIRGHFSCTL
ncbi:hypothetical protein WG66_001819 [Moniliophthora roreri]|nr:hypothetical protein WG66_001819 [Moniliophthora roreri]